MPYQPSELIMLKFAGLLIGGFAASFKMQYQALMYVFLVGLYANSFGDFGVLTLGLLITYVMGQGLRIAREFGAGSR